MKKVRAGIVVGVLAAMLGWGHDAHALLFCPSGNVTVAVAYDLAGSTLKDSFTAADLTKSLAMRGTVMPSLPSGVPTCKYLTSTTGPAQSFANTTVTARADYVASAANNCRAAKFSAVVTSGTFRGTVAAFTVASGTKVPNAAGTFYKCRYTLPIKIPTMTSSNRSQVCTKTSRLAFGMRPECDVVQGPIQFLR